MSGRWQAAAVVALVALAAAPVLAQPRGPAAGGPGITIEQAEQIARQVISRLGVQGLAPAHIMEFTNHYYVAVEEKAGGQGAFELLIDRYTGAAHPEPGPNMMWNTKYSPMFGSGMGYGMMGMGGMMGGYGPGMGPGMMGPGTRGQLNQVTPPAVAPTVTPAQARTFAQRFLDARFAGARVGEAITFPGYVTLDVAREARVVGMLSVNTYTGQVWYHAWHGEFVREKDVE